MRKGFLIVLAVALVAVLAAPAMAGTDINGFYRAKAYVTNFDFPSAPSVATDMTSGGYVEQRFRMRFSFGEENVKAIAFFEIDFSSWGDSAGGAAPGAAARNSGGALGGDKINLETKNVYVWFKVPDTSLDFAVGLQNQTDSMQGLFYGAADMAGIFATGKFEPVSWKLGWSKFYENNVQNWDDMTLAMAYVSFAPSKDAKLGIGFYSIQDSTFKSSVTSTTQLPGLTALGINPALNGNLSPAPALNSSVATNTKMIYTIPIDFAVNAGPVALSGFGLYQFGSVDFTGAASSRPSIDISAFAADVRADMKLGPGKFFVEGLVLGGGDNSGDKYQSMVTTSDLNASPGGNSAFTRLGYQLLMGNADDVNQNTCLIGCAGALASPNSVSNQSPGNGGRGLWTVGLGYSMKAAEKLNLAFGAGYLAAVKKLVTDPGTMDTDMGWEINASGNYNIMKGLDFGLYGAYGELGDFYTGWTGTSDPDSIWTMFARLNYAF